MQLTRRIYPFTVLGKFLRQFSVVSFAEDPDLKKVNVRFAEPFKTAMRQAELANPWFTAEFIMTSFSALSTVLTGEELLAYLGNYPELEDENNRPVKTAIVMAGNIPLVGFRDLLDVCLSGNTALVKMSSRDEKLFPVIRDILVFCEPELEDRIRIVSAALKDPEAVIATGSDNSSRYFSYYFGKYPHLIRKNRNSAAVLTGSESPEELRSLADDVFLYFGMGCRSVSKLFIPRDFNIPRMLDNFQGYSYLYNHNKYANNYDYHRAVFLVNRGEHLDTGFLLLREDPGYASPVSVLYYEYYDSLPALEEKLKNDAEKIQCTVAGKGVLKEAVDFGRSQFPGLLDFADGADTMKFLINLYKK